MSQLIFIPFAVFFACCVMQFWFLRQVRNSLIDRHPDTYLAVARSSIFPQGGLLRFVRSGAHKQLDDEKLSRQVMRTRWLYAGAFGSWLILVIVLFTTAG